MFKAKILTLGHNPNQKRIIEEDTGAPQGNILSPILCNIYLNTLDKFMENLIKKHNKGHRAERDPEYARATAAPRDGSENLLSPEEQQRRILNRKKQAHKKGLRYTLINDKFIRIKYVRYADDFIIGVRGPKELACHIKKEVEFFLKSNLQLEINQDKSQITDTFSAKAHFLGMTIHNVPTHLLSHRKTAHVEKIRRNSSRRVNRIIAVEDRLMKAARENILNQLREKYRKALKNDETETYKKNLEDQIEQTISISPIKEKNNEIMRNFVKELTKVSLVQESKKLKELTEI